MNLRPLLVLALAPLMLLLGGCERDEAPAGEAAAPPLVRTAVVELVESGGWSLTGSVQARFESQLGFRVGGKITRRHVDVGDRVREDELLLELDDADLRLAVSAAEAALRAAEARERNARLEAERLAALLPRQAISQQEHDRAQTEAEAASEALASARSALRQARNQLSYAVLHADADGVVVAVSGESGQVVAAGQTVVVVAQDGPREAEVYIPEERLGQISEQARATRYRQRQQADARLRELASRADPLTRSWPARFVLESPLDEAPLGATVMLEFGAAGKTLRRVPISALIEQGEGPAVWLVEPLTEGAENGEARVRRHAVTVLRLGSERAVIEADLPPDAAVVSLGVNRLVEGQRVRPLGPVVPEAAR